MTAGHFDHAKVDAMLATAVAECKQRIAMDERYDATDRLLHGALYDVNAYFLRHFVLLAKENGIPHERVAAVAGCVLAQLYWSVRDNYKCACVDDHLIDAFGVGISGREALPISDSIIFAERGGRA